MKALWIGLVTLTALCLMGCPIKKVATNYGTTDTLRGGYGSIQIVMQTDTLRFLPGDSVIDQGYIIIKGGSGHPLPGIKVSIELTERWGSLEFVGNQDTTDTQGKVYIVFRAFGQVGSGRNTIHAWTGSKEDRVTLWLQPASDCPTPIMITVSRPMVYPTPDAEDTVIVTVTVSDSSSNGVPGVVIPVHASGGLLTPLPATDAHGMAQTRWYTHGVASGDYFISARYENMTDTARIRVHNVLPPKGERE